jgi:hypothetical protein
MKDNKRSRRRLFDLSTCYSGCMLGIALSATVFREYTRKYPIHRQRMAACLEELGASVTLPLRHKDFVAQHEAIMSSVQSELARVSSPHLGWMLFGATLIDFAVKRAFRRADVMVARRALRLFLDKLQLPRTVLSNLSRKSKTEKDGTLSLYKLHSAALAALREIISCMGRDPRTAFVTEAAAAAARSQVKLQVQSISPRRAQANRDARAGGDLLHRVFGVGQIPAPKLHAEALNRAILS